MRLFRTAASKTTNATPVLPKAAARQNIFKGPPLCKTRGKRLPRSPRDRTPPLHDAHSGVLTVGAAEAGPNVPCKTEKKTQRPTVVAVCSAAHVANQHLDRSAGILTRFPFAARGERRHQSDAAACPQSCARLGSA